MKTVICVILLLAGGARAGSILMYHHVSDSTPPATSVTPAEFARHLSLLADSDLQVVPLTDLMQRVASGRPHDGLVAITFDDAYASIAANALPLLEARGWTAAIFVSVAQIGGSAMMSLPDLRSAHARGHAILNHGFDHAQMVRQPVAESIAAIEKAQAFLSKHFASPRYVAWPYGESSPALQQALASKQYLAFGQHTGPLDAAMNWQAIPRIAVNSRYAQWEPLHLKLTSLPLPVLGTEPAGGITTDVRPALRLRLAADWRKALNCFVDGAPLSPVVERFGDAVEVYLQTPTPLAPGRHRYTCTAAADGRFHWYSWLWMVKDGDQWYDEP